MEELLKKINGNLIEIKSKLDKDTFHISGGRNNIGQQNNYTLENKFMPEKINKDEQKLNVRKIPTLYPISIQIKNLMLSFLFLLFLTTLFLDVKNEKAFIIIVVVSIIYFFIHYSNNLKIIVNDNFIKVDSKTFHFNEIRKIKFNSKKFDNYISIYLKDSVYPDIKIYLRNEDQMDLIDEFYNSYLKNQK